MYLKELRRQRHFKIPGLTRPKVDPKEHGTEINGREGKTGSTAMVCEGS